MQSGTNGLEPGVVVVRYNYIATELLRLSRETHQLFAMFVTVITVLVSASASTLLTWKSLGVDLTAIVTAQKMFAALVSFVSGAAVILLFANVMSWLDYRYEEHRLLSQYGLAFREPASLHNLWRWFEFWFGLLAVTIGVGVWFVLYVYILPLLR
jgi:hypothetical protein